MKKFYFLLCMFLAVNMYAVNGVADFEEAAITPAEANSAYLLNETGTFTSGNFTFGQYVDVSWGPAYYYGFVVSNHTDVTFVDYNDAYQVVGGQAHSGSNYAVWYASWYGNDRIQVAGDDAKVLDYCYINNNTYCQAAYVDGFGLTDGAFTTSDWSLLTIYGWNGDTKTDSIEVYMAKDGSYIQEWTKVDLRDLGAVTELSFAMSSSRNNAYGNEAPTYFCIDDVTELVLENVILGALLPENGMPANGVNLLGTFSDDPIAMEVVEATGAYAVFDLMASGSDTFTFVDADNEDNYLVMRNAAGEWVPALFVCSEVWEDDTWKGDPVKMIDLDLTDNTKYAWSTDIPEGLEEVRSNKAESTKVMINGMLYIVRDGKMFNVLGAEVR